MFTIYWPGANTGHVTRQFVKKKFHLSSPRGSTVKILKIGTPEIITIIVLQLEHFGFYSAVCVQKMQTE